MPSIVLPEAVVAFTNRKSSGSAKLGLLIACFKKEALRRSPIPVNSGPYPSPRPSNTWQPPQPLLAYTRAPRAGSPGRGSGGILLSDRTNAATFATSSSSRNHAPGILGGIPSAITKFSVSSSGACARCTRLSAGPRPPLPSMPWHNAQCRSNNRFPTAASPRRVFSSERVCRARTVPRNPQPSNPPKAMSANIFLRTVVTIGAPRTKNDQCFGSLTLGRYAVNSISERTVCAKHPISCGERILQRNAVCGVLAMRAFLFAGLIFVGIGVLTWATAKPNDGRANAKAAFPKPAVDAPLASAKSAETAVVSGGCFWGIQAVFQHLKGVVSATSSYSGGAANTAHYED